MRLLKAKDPPWRAMPLRVVQSPSVAGWWFWAPPIQASLQGGAQHTSLLMPVVGIS